MYDLTTTATAWSTLTDRRDYRSDEIIVDLFFLMNTEGKRRCVVRESEPSEAECFKWMKVWLMAITQLIQKHDHPPLIERSVVHFEYII